jgi:hypothetical protein
VSPAGTCSARARSATTLNEARTSAVQFFRPSSVTHANRNMLKKGVWHAYGATLLDRCVRYGTLRRTHALDMVALGDGCFCPMVLVLQNVLRHSDLYRDAPNIEPYNGITNQRPCSNKPRNIILANVSVLQLARPKVNHFHRVTVAILIGNGFA